MLTVEWKRRVDAWRDSLKSVFYRPLEKLVLRGAVVRDQLSVESAGLLEFREMPEGTRWGDKWDYGWFKCVVRVPDTAAGRRIVCRIKTGGESRVIVNGAAKGAFDRQHEFLTLTSKARGGEEFDILLESYAGHGPTSCGGGPVTPVASLTTPDLPMGVAIVGDCSFGIWEEEVYQLWLDVETLCEVRNVCDQKSLRTAEIDRALRDFTVLLDPEAAWPEFIEGVRACRERLLPLLQCVNGSTSPLFNAFGHSHLDVAWLWTLAETERKTARTLATQLALMDEYPEYVFLQSTPYLYEVVKRLYPELYERIRTRVGEGRFIPEGGMWVEADTNVPSGESLIRQFVHGKRFFLEEFGTESEMLWLPDVFGYSGALPQIMAGCGIKYFGTAKIFWNYNGGDAFPYNHFTWEGIDGSTVVANLFTGYSNMTSPAHLAAIWNEQVQTEGPARRLLPFGYGDGGGGATRDQLEFLRREKNLEGVPRTLMGSPVRFFRETEREAEAARYVGELYYQCHRGTYTSQARTKRGNRRCEIALREGELWAVAAAALRKREYPRGEFDAAWKKVLLNQFHDILPGSSLREVYEEAEKLYDEVLKTTAARTETSQRALAGDEGRGIVVFNSLSWERTALVELPGDVDGVVTSDGTAAEAQTIDGRTYAEVKTPPCGWTTLKPGRPARQNDSDIRAEHDLLENEFLRVRLNEFGEIVSMLDKESGSELTDGICNRFRMYKDIPGSFDAWDIDSMYELTPAPLEEPAEVTVLSEGPLLAGLRVSRKLANSSLRQDIMLRRNSRTLEFRTTIDWHERHRLLKVAFPVNIHSHEAIHEIQFGYIKRPNHQSRAFDADRFEVCQQKWSALCEADRGVALLNDCKYGLNVKDNSMNLTLLRAPVAPDPKADQGRHEFTYALFAWNGSLADSEVVRRAYELNVPVTQSRGEAADCSLFEIDAPGVVLDGVKAAEDDSGDVILRLYESLCSATTCRLRVALAVESAWQTDMLERRQAPLEFVQGGLNLRFKPFEIKTVRLKLNS